MKEKPELILARVRKIFKRIEKNNYKKQTSLDRELLEKIILTLEKVIEYIKKEK